MTGDAPPLLSKRELSRSAAAERARPAGYGLALTSVVLAAAVLSSSYTLTKIALRDVPPLTIGVIRFSLAAVLLAIWVHGIRRHPPPLRRDLWRLSLGGILGITFYFAIENTGVHLATASDAALLVASYPALTALLELLIYRRRIRLSGVAGICLAVLGVFLIIGYAPGNGSSRLIGDVLLVVSGVIWAFYSFVTRSVGGRYPTSVILYYQTLAGAAGFLPLALLEWNEWRIPTDPAGTWVSLLALTVLCSVAGLGLYANGLRKLRPSTAVNVLNLVPVFGLLVPTIALGEDVTSQQLLGGLVVVAGVTISARAEHSPSQV